MMTLRAHKRASPLVAYPHLAFHLCRDMAGPGRGSPRDRPPRTCRRGELPLLHLTDDGVESPVEDFPQIAGGHAVAEERPGVLELLPIDPTVDVDAARGINHLWHI